MLKRLLQILKKREIILYILFGILTTAVNWAVCLPLHYKFGLSAAISNDIAWVAAVLFAYFTNKIFVFKNNDWKPKTLGVEMLKFFGARFLTGRLETGILYLTVDHLGFNVLLWKALTAVIVIVLNYIFSKLMIFRKKNNDQ